LLGTIIFALVEESIWNEVFVLSIAIWAMGTALIWWVLDAYQDLREGTWGIGWLFYTAALVLFWLFGARAKAGILMRANLYKSSVG